MEKQIEEYYKSYQKKSDPLIIQSYLELEKKSKESNQLETSHRLTAIKKVIEERGLKLPKEKSDTAFNDYLKSGFKSLLIGIVLFILGLALINYFEGNFVFYLALIIGGFKFLQGVIELSVGLYIRVSEADRFR